MIKPKNFGLWGNTDKSVFWQILPKIIDWADSNKIQIYITEKIQTNVEFNANSIPVINSNEKISEMDFMLVLGGDGTFLSCARAVEHHDTPILGIHLGDLGFLAKVTLDDIFQRLDQVAKGDYLIEKRSMVKAVLKKTGSEKVLYGLNDFVVTSGESHRLLVSEVFVNGRRVSEYRSDGLIVATPTGSTAYSLSSGGPIIAPDVDSFVITPISAHSLNSRPLVVSNKSSIEIKFSNYNQDIIFITDGQLHEILRPNDVALISNSNFQIGLIDFDDTDYFHTLRIKMGWGTRGGS
ncbi:NAD(+)/NADH kinase [bacterium]|jgi:NAD+ kinase|nr:NAD(+)/NADH kinase [bacterium]MBT6017710.1 NAD(+)/NADH kinase [bacterium]MDG1224667.1 NAD(+)/NADH kinase [Candidatus Neomarinimicrobiota bacterium]